jgi:HEXXH motif-containing protein
MTDYHQLEPTVFGEIAAGGGGPDGIAALHRSQVSKHLMLIGHLLDQWPGELSERDAIETAFERAGAAAPERYLAVIGAPLVGGYTSIVARAIERGTASRADFAHLGALAVAACWAAGIDGAAEGPVYQQLAMVPGFGAAEVGDVESVRLEVSHSRLVVRGHERDGGRTVEVPADPTEPAPGWQPVRRLIGDTGGLRIDVGLDDLDPYRHGHHAPPATRLGAAEVDAWREVFGDAWRLLVEHRRERAAELAAGLRTLIPLRQEDARTARSATLRHVFGAFGLTRPTSAAEFAVTLVHEFQHSKLSAVLDMEQLTDPDDQGRYFAPWRTDPRPLAGLVQGVYAFAGVADTWLGLRAAEGIGALAERHFAEARLQVHHGLVSIERSGALTARGAELAARLRTTVDAMLAEPVSPAVADAAEQAFNRTCSAWAERNGAYVGGGSMSPSSRLPS